MNVYLIIIVILSIGNMIALTSKAIRRKYITLYGRAFASFYVAVSCVLYMLCPGIYGEEVIYVGILLMLFFSLSDILVYFILKNQYSALSYIQAMKQLAAISDKYQSIVENTPIGFYVIDEFGRVEYVNRYVAEMTGYTKEELIGKKVYDVVCEEYHETVRENIRRRLSGEVKSVDYIVKAKNKMGKIFTVRFSGSRTENGHVTITGSVIIVED